MARESGPSSTPQLKRDGEAAPEPSIAGDYWITRFRGAMTAERQSSRYPCRTSANTAKYRSGSVHTWRGSQPEPRASAPNDLRRVLVAVLGVDRLAGAEVDGLADDPHLLALACWRDASRCAERSRLKNAWCSKRREIEIGAELAIDAGEQVEVERGRDARPRRCRRRCSTARSLTRSTPTMSTAPGPSMRAAWLRNAAGLVRLEIADGRAGKEAGVRQRSRPPAAGRTAW